MAKPVFEVTSVPSRDETISATLAHIGALIGMFFFPMNIIVPLVILLFKGGDSSFVREHARESLNFQISSTVFIIISAFASVVLIGIPFLLAFIVISFVCPISGSVRASAGEGYRYMWTFRIV